MKTPIKREKIPELSKRLLPETQKNKKNEAVEIVEVKTKVYRIMPVNDMVKKNWIPKPIGADGLLKCVRKIWGTDNFDYILRMIDSNPLPSFRKTEKDIRC